MPPTTECSHGQAELIYASLSRKFKLPNQQNGQVYLTSHRVCYVDKADARKHSVALDLKEVERYEFYVGIRDPAVSCRGITILRHASQAGFLKSSAKITLIPRPTKRASLQSRPPALGSTLSRGDSAPASQRAESPFRGLPGNPPPASSATWVCTICSFSNPVPSNFDPAIANAHTPLPPCLACGIKPTLTHVLKASISNAANRPALTAPLPVRPRPHSDVAVQPPREAGTSSTDKELSTAADPDASFQCPRCTFLNHPSLLSCEICGAPLISHDLPAELAQRQTRTESPGPLMTASFGSVPGVENPESVKISFHRGGEKIFYERLKTSMTQRKWLLQDAPPIPKSNRGGGDSALGSSSSGVPAERVKGVGIAGLEKRGEDLRQKRVEVIGTAFEDLEALMASAKEVVALAEAFAKESQGVNGGASSEANALLAAESVSQLGLVTTKDIVGSGSSKDSLYLSELARNMAEFLTDDTRGVLRKAGGIISLVDLWALFNRARGGVELVSPAHFEKAAGLWEKLRLPVRLRTFRSGVMVVQSRDRTDEATIKTLLAWLRDLHDIPPDTDLLWDWQEFGRGVTAQDTAARFGWSIGVAEEELEMAEERGVLCREEGIEGLKFWENYIDAGEYRAKRRREAKDTDNDSIIRVLRESGFM